MKPELPLSATSHVFAFVPPSRGEMTIQYGGRLGSWTAPSSFDAESTKWSSTARTTSRAVTPASAFLKSMSTDTAPPAFRSIVTPSTATPFVCAIFSPVMRSP